MKIRLWTGGVQEAYPMHLRTIQPEVVKSKEGVGVLGFNAAAALYRHTISVNDPALLSNFAGTGEML